MSKPSSARAQASGDRFRQRGEAAISRLVDHTTVIALALLFALGATLYSSVGHGGASAYIAAMALLGLAPETMKPTALALNLLVAGFGAWRYWRRGLTNWRLVLAFALAATPAAFIGGAIHLPEIYYKPLVGLLLWAAAARLLWQPKALAERPVKAPPLWLSLPAGGVLGLLAGLTGTGGGIFLSPLIILNAWEEPRRTSGVVAAFIVLNSLAGLTGNAASVGHLPPQLPIFLAAVGAGALIGTWLGVERLPRPWLLRTLGLVLTVAGAKLLLT
ncbi:MAG: sulfite exporter TauE/SafE family protein [Sphingomonas sp.]